MFFDVWKAYKEVCGGATLTREDRVHILQQLEDRIRESQIKSMLHEGAPLPSKFQLGDVDAAIERQTLRDNAVIEECAKVVEGMWLITDPAIRQAVADAIRARKGVVDKKDQSSDIPEEGPR